MITFSEQNQIQITQIDSPHKFWYKNCNDLMENRRLKELENSIEKYVTDLRKWEEQQVPIKRGDEIAAFHAEWQKWIRGKAGRLKPGSKVDIFIWAIDYGCKLTMPLENVYLLQDQSLACKNPINVHIGGLSGISPVEFSFNFDTMRRQILKTNCWSRESIDKFSQCIDERKFVTFHVEDKESERSFGQLQLHSQNGNSNTLSVAQCLCDWEVATRDRNYLFDVQPLDREDFLRLNHQLAFCSGSDNEMAMAEDEMAQAERIWNYFGEQLSSNDLELENESKHARSHTNSMVTMPISGIDGNSLSEETMTLSVKKLYKLNSLIITGDEVTPANQWNDLSYFTDQTKTFLMRYYPDGIDQQSSYAWPHIMRTNSLFSIGDPVKNMLMCLPTVCSIKPTISTSSSEFLKPIAFIFVTCAEEVKQIASYCRKLIEKSEQCGVNVCCLNSSFEIDALINSSNTIDILVAPVFCFNTIVQHMPNLTKHLCYVWFHQIDEMCRINEELTYHAANHLAFEDLDIQILTTSKSYSPILSNLFDRVKVPMISIGDQTPFEAALFAKCHFAAVFDESEKKIRRVIEKLQYRLSGSIVVMCANQKDVKFVTGHLTQANIKCIDLDEQYSGNQMKLINWSKRCLSAEAHTQPHLNILVCDDGALEKFPIRSAQHIIHYSLPDKVQAFSKRFITCYGFYEDRLCRKFLFREKDLPRPISLVYFDEHLTDEYIEIFELLLNRTECQLPTFLIETVQRMRFEYEQNKTKPVCAELITRSANCGMQCPYRHTLYNKCNNTFVPEYGYVNMDVLAVLAPNHFAVRVIGHKRLLQHKSKSVECLNYEWEEFDKRLREYYANASRENHDRIEIGDICLIFHQSQPKRCRILSIEKKRVSVFLVDVGRVRCYAPEQLYRLNEEFQDFPTQAIEVFVLGYVPADCNPKWLPEAKEYVEQMMRLINNQRKTQNYLQAEVIKAFERTLIVKDLKILFKAKHQLRLKSIDKNLVKCGFANERPIELHDIFKDDIDDEIDSEIMDNTAAHTMDLHCSMQLSRTPSSDGIRVTSLENFEYPPATRLKIAYLSTKHKGSTSSASLNDGQGMCYGKDDGGTTSPDYNNMDEPEWDEIDEKTICKKNQACTSGENIPEQALATDGIDTKLMQSDIQLDQNERSVNEPPRLLSLNEIFGSLPDIVHAVDVLTPIQSNSDSLASNSNQHTENEFTGWLIDFSDSTDMPSPFTHVRNTCSIVDLLMT